VVEREVELLEAANVRQLEPLDAHRTQGTGDLAPLLGRDDVALDSAGSRYTLAQMAISWTLATLSASLSAAALLSGCAPDPVCTPGASVACIGAGGCVGGQRCNASGSGFNDCVCEAPIDAGVVDAMTVVDAGACQARAGYGNAIATDQRAVASGALSSGTPTFVRFSGALNADAAPDQIVIRLAKDYGVFPGEIITGTFDLAGPELGLASCGVCVTIAADVTDGVPASTYLATGGSVTITSVTPNLTGTLSNVTFEQVDVAGTVSTAHPDPCKSAIETLSFNTSVTVEP